MQAAAAFGIMPGEGFSLRISVPDAPRKSSKTPKTDRLGVWGDQYAKDSASFSFLFDVPEPFVWCSCEGFCNEHGGWGGRHLRHALHGRTDSERHRLASGSLEIGARLILEENIERRLE